MTMVPLEMTVDERSVTNRRVRLTGWGRDLNYVEVSNNLSGPTSGTLASCAASVYIDKEQYDVLQANVGTMCTVRIVVEGDCVTKFDFT